MHCLCRIHNDVHKDLFQLPDIPPDEGQKGIEFLYNPNIVKQGLIDQEEEAVSDGPIDVRGLLLRFGLAGELEQTFDDIWSSTR